jgi:hypothetical protein
VILPREKEKFGPVHAPLTSKVYAAFPRASTEKLSKSKGNFDNSSILDFKFGLHQASGGPLGKLSVLAKVLIDALVQ